MIIVVNEFSHRDLLEDHADTSTIYLSNETVFNYIKQGNKSTPNQADGYLVEFVRDCAEAYSFTILSEQNLTSINFIQVVIQYVHFNRNQGTLKEQQVIFIEMY